MRLSTKGRYAVTAMLELALHDDGPLTLADISHSQGISLSYLEQLFAALRAKNLVYGVRGPGGGYHLGKPAQDISIADVICAVDEWTEFTRCSGRCDCHDGHRCLTHALWQQLSDQVYSFLNDISLNDLVQRKGHACTNPNCLHREVAIPVVGEHHTPDDTRHAVTMTVS